MPDAIGELRSLRKISLTGCYSLVSLPHAFTRLYMLHLLDLSHCSSLATLPDAFGLLIALESLDLAWCKILELPDSLTRLSSLRRLVMVGCSMVALPEDMGSLTALTILDLGRRYQPPQRDVLRFSTEAVTDVRRLQRGRGKGPTPPPRLRRLRRAALLRRGVPDRRLGNRPQADMRRAAPPPGHLQWRPADRDPVAPLGVLSVAPLRERRGRRPSVPGRGGARNRGARGVPWRVAHGHRCAPRGRLAGALD